MPIIGDPITLAAGVMKEPLWRFMIVVGIAKVVRYMVVLAVAEEFIS
jgi:membrane protein YqaA with SNARE-associated domain